MIWIFAKSYSKIMREEGKKLGRWDEDEEKKEKKRLTNKEKDGEEEGRDREGRMDGRTSHG